MKSAPNTDTFKLSTTKNFQLVSNAPKLKFTSVSPRIEIGWLVIETGAIADSLTSKLAWRQ